MEGLYKQCIYLEKKMLSLQNELYHERIHSQDIHKQLDEVKAKLEAAEEMAVFLRKLCDSSNWHYGEYDGELEEGDEALNKWEEKNA